MGELKVLKVSKIEKSIKVSTQIQDSSVLPEFVIVQYIYAVEAYIPSSLVFPDGSALWGSKSLSGAAPASFAALSGRLLV